MQNKNSPKTYDLRNIIAFGNPGMLLVRTIDNTNWLCAQHFVVIIFEYRMIRDLCRSYEILVLGETGEQTEYE